MAWMFMLDPTKIKKYKSSVSMYVYIISTMFA